MWRTARRGARAGQQFWGCARFPKCRGKAIADPPGTAAGEPSRIAPAGEPPPGSGDGDSARRRMLESEQPDATGRWDRAHRRKVLRYVHERDGGRCGLCAGEMPLKGAHLEHIVPKVFAVFDVRRGGRAEPGTRYTSRLHRLDNLQAAHTYCNRRKGNSPKVRDWRHPAMAPLPVADTADGSVFVLPWTRRR